MKCTYVIRSLAESDAGELLKFYDSRPSWVVRWFDPFPQPTLGKIKRHLRRARSGNAVSMALLGSSERSIAGHGFVLKLNSERPCFGIGLCESAMGEGYGRRLMAAVLHEVDRLCIPRVTLTVFKDNMRARRLYESFGFVTTGESSCRSSGDSLAMERALCGL